MTTKTKSKTTPAKKSPSKPSALNIAQAKSAVERARILSVKLAAADMKGQVAAIGKSLAVIEFATDGTILTANENFLEASGYTLAEIRNQHHSLFVDKDERASPEYRVFWDKLARGEHDSGTYKRFAKNGREVWLQATYNPILDDQGVAFKVVKYATDVTQAKLQAADFSGQLSAISKAQAVIEFSLDGKILSANQNFCKALGYPEQELVGKHHSMLVDAETRHSAEYAEFWTKLGRGEFDAGQYRRVAKGGREVWIQASYNPIFDMSGKPFKVVKYAIDITKAKLQAADFEGQLSAIGKAQAVIEFSLDGKILTANENFLQTVGYTLEEVRGQHHAMFVSVVERTSPEYRQFWEKLGRGEFDAGQYKRLAKGGREVWIQASYNPIFDMNGRPFKVVKYATDITLAKLQAADFSGQLSAISKAQGVIEFDLKGNILNANENFLKVVGYTAEEVKGQHHGMFVQPEVRNSQDYLQFWEKLGRGEFDAGQYKRLAKGGREVWIQASYNPIFDMNGKPFKVVKYATDISNAKLQAADFSGQLLAISKAQAVIEFSLDGTVLNANENFLSTFGYSLKEITGQHHGMFVDPALRSSHEYRVFWDKLGRGEYDSGQYKRYTKSGREVWIQASYNPIFDMNGKPFKVVKYATDVSEQKLTMADFSGQIAAIGKSQAVIEFDMKGHIINANDNFLRAMGYGIDELRGQHHRLFLDPAEAVSLEYRAFWEKLGRGEYDSGQYKRVAKGGREVWIQASYNPIFDMNGRPFKVVKYATDITDAKLKAADFEGQLSAIGKAQGIIEFKLDGTILNANENFLTTVGYRLEEIKGRHHSMFVERVQRESAEYRSFWEKLGRGEHDQGQYRRVGKDGREVYIQASYNPILDLNGKPFKVVKYCTNVGDQVRAAQQLAIAVQQTQEVVQSARDGQLSGRIPMEGKDGEIGDLCGGVNAVLDSMSGVVGQIKVASEAISTAAREIAAGNDDLSSRTEQQAASLEETASSMEELTSTVKQNAENAKQANQLAIGASDVAIRGGRVVSSVITTMTQISEASKKIADIIGVIDGIAFQTNILALNAAVEAARAGEQGRGFAVVAAEVRSLAQRSAGAAKEIKSLIGDSVEKVSNGSKLVEQAGATMDEIVTSVKRVTDIMSEITAASQEQSQGIEQVNQTISQMDEMTQQNAALVEEATASARSLEEQAGGLSDCVSAFRLEADAPSNSPAASKTKPAMPAAMPQRGAATRPVLRAVRSNAPPAARSAPVRRASAASAAPAKAAGDGQWTEF